MYFLHFLPVSLCRTGKIAKISMESVVVKKIVPVLHSSLNYY